MTDFLKYLVWLCRTRGTPEALQFAALLEQPPTEPTTEDEQIAAELTRPAKYVSKTAMRLRQRTFFSLRSIDCVLAAINELDYLPLLVDALLRYHRKALLLAQPGTDAITVRLDLEWAINQLTPTEQYFLHRLTEVPPGRYRRRTIKWKGKRRMLVDIKRDLLAKVCMFLRHPTRREYEYATTPAPTVNFNRKYMLQRKSSKQRRRKKSDRFGLSSGIIIIDREIDQPAQRG